jgi:hypothetical protein
MNDIDPRPIFVGGNLDLEVLDVLRAPTHH